MTTQGKPEWSSKPSWIESLFWICCSKCHSFPRPEITSFFVTDCGHIYCSKCRDIVASTQCSVCHKNGVKFLEIKKDITNHPEVGTFFNNIPDMLTRMTKLVQFVHLHKQLNTRFSDKGPFDQKSLVARCGPIAMTPLDDLDKLWVDVIKRKRQREQALRVKCHKVNLELAEIEAIVSKVKSLGVTEAVVLSVQRNGKPLSSVRIVSEVRSDLQTAARVLYAATKKGQSNKTNTCPTPTQHGIPERTRGQSSAPQLGLTPQHQIRGGPHQPPGGPPCTPHQFGLTPFQRSTVETPSPSSLCTPTNPALKRLLPPPPPPPLPPSCRLTASNHSSPSICQTPVAQVGMPPPRLPPPRKTSSQHTPGHSPSPISNSQPLNRQFMSSQSMQTPLQQQGQITPQTNKSRPLRPSPLATAHASYRSPLVNTGAAGSARGPQLTPSQCHTPTNQMIRTVNQQSLRSAEATPSPSEMMTPRSVTSSINRSRTPMSIHSGSPSPQTVAKGRVSVRALPYGGRMGPPSLTPEGTPTCIRGTPQSCYSTPRSNSGGRSSAGGHSGGGHSGSGRRQVPHYPTDKLTPTNKSTVFSY